MKMNGPSVDVVWEPPSSLECWDYSIELACLKGGPEDLQLAAELGKTLLERNKELENSLKEHQTTIEEQAQEIEHMKKGTAALRDVNYHRLKIYEQLEVSIQDLERANRRLVIENTSDKKLIKSQGLTIENLETKCEDLQKKIDDLKSQCDSLQRLQASQTQSAHNEPQSLPIWKASVSQDGSIHQSAARSPTKPSTEASAEICIRQLGSTVADDEEVTEILRQLQESRNQRAREQKRVAELTEQLATLFQENTALEDQLSVWRNKAQDMKNLQDEINTLEEVRQGHLCGRCLRGIDLSTHDELSVMLDQEEDDDISMADSFVNDTVREREDETTIKQTIATNRREKAAYEHNHESLIIFIWELIKSAWSVPMLFALIMKPIAYLKTKYLLPALMMPFRFPYLILRRITPFRINRKLW